MNNDTNNMLWAYVHGELDAQERGRIEQALRDNPALRAEEERARALDSLLRELIPLSAKSEDDLTQAVLQVWERSPEALETNPQQPSFRLSGAESVRWRGAWRVALAAAACLLVAFGVRFACVPPAIEWDQPDIAGPPVTRGADKSAEALYSRETLRDFSAELRAAIKTEYEKAASESGKKPWLRTERDWKLRDRFQGLRGGNFAVGIEAFEPGKAAALKEWVQYFASREDFLSNMPSFARLVAHDLCEMKAK